MDDKRVRQALNYAIDRKRFIDTALGGGFGHFYAYAPTKIEYAIDRFAMEVKRQLDVLDRNVANWQKQVAAGTTTVTVYLLDETARLLDAPLGLGGARLGAAAQHRGVGEEVTQARNRFGSVVRSRRIASLCATSGCWLTFTGIGGDSSWYAPCEAGTRTYLP
jgi:hypothetical protein